jgi:hypothetical protein
MWSGFWDWVNDGFSRNIRHKNDQVKRDVFQFWRNDQLMLWWGRSSRQPDLGSTEPQAAGTGLVISTLENVDGQSQRWMNMRYA